LGEPVEAEVIGGHRGVDIRFVAEAEKDHHRHRDDEEEDDIGPGRERQCRRAEDSVPKRGHAAPDLLCAAVRMSTRAWVPSLNSLASSRSRIFWSGKMRSRSSKPSSLAFSSEPLTPIG